VKTIHSIGKAVSGCRRCPRLVAWREEVARTKVARFSSCDYWGKPVPGFGDPDPRLLVVGLAPAAHGGNRTGRIFTGDRSGDWLYRALHKAGFANQPESLDRNDGLRLKDCYVAAAARCAPPANKLLPSELEACRPFLSAEMKLMPHLRVIIVLGRVAADTVFDICRDNGLTSLKRRPAFGHGAEHQLNEHLTMIASYHPSQQNTFTGRLTEPMFDAVFRRTAAILKSR
jgi:uracil-DNA glycosylase